MKKILKKLIPSQVWLWLIGVRCKLIRIQEEVYYFVAMKYYRNTFKMPRFLRIKLVYAVHNYSMIDMKGLLTTYDIAMLAKDEEGCFIECGVARGGCGALMAMILDNHILNDRHTWLFDSYEGLPKPGDKDKEVSVNVPKDRHSMVLSEGYCLGTLQEVNNILYHHFNLDKKYVHTVKGWFDKTLPEYKNKVGRVALLKLDADWYESVKCCIENLWDNVVVGGYIYIDDYHLSGCQKAILEFLHDKRLMPVITSDGRGGAWFRK